jgi:outer membrane protein OmpA-like peptidoglycan-associated protein/tetratricopeptide (TPR) repeat protein
MNKFRLPIVVCFLFTLVSNQLFAQLPKYSTTNKGAINAYEDGTKQLDGGNFDKAIPYFEKAINKDSLFIEAHMVLGDIYAEKDNFEKAISCYDKAANINPTFFPNNFFLLGDLQLRVGKYEDAKKSFTSYLKIAQGIPEEKKARTNRKLNNCDFGINALKNPVAFNPKNLGPGVNSEGGEYYPSITVDQQQLIITRRFKDERLGNQEQEDFYFSKLKDSVWQRAINPGPPLNSLLNEGAPSVSADGKLVFFAACERPDGKGKCDIYLSQLMADGSWTKPFNLGAPINTGAWETQPSFSSDGKTLYFIRGYSTREKGQVQDIYSSTFQADMTWSEPIPLSDTINTDGVEESVFIHPDNQTLYFSSDGHTGMGGLDIFVSRRLPNGRWGVPMNLGYPINTSSNENSMMVSPDGKKAYFSSNRKDGYGDLDLYSFDLYKEAQPLLVSYIRAKVTDATSGNPLAAKFEIIDVETGNVVLSNTTDKRRGEFLACLPAGKNYMLNVNKETYLFYSDYFECKEANDKQSAYDLLIKLRQPVAGEKVVLKNIFFDVNKFDLKKESDSELGKLVAFLKNSPAIKIEISGHTDNTGDKKANLILSENRAKAVYDYLIKQGIVATRLTYKGYGDTKSIADNNSETGRAQNRRTEFTIL